MRSMMTLSGHYRFFLPYRFALVLRTRSLCKLFSNLRRIKACRNPTTSLQLGAEDHKQLLPYRKFLHRYWRAPSERLHDSLHPIGWTYRTSSNPNPAFTANSSLSKDVEPFETAVDSRNEQILPPHSPAPPDHSHGSLPAAPSASALASPASSNPVNTI